MDWKAVLNSALQVGRVESGTIGLRSPAAEWLQMPQLTAWSKGSVEAQWALDPRALNSRGVLFGGYYGVLADAVLALAAMTVLADNEYFTTSDLSLNFFRPISSGLVTLKAEVLNRGRSSVYTEMRFYDEEGRLLARASSMLAIISPPGGVAAPGA